jgi:nitroreductase
MEYDKVAKARKSVREFTSKKPDWRDIIECIDVARYAPTAGNNFTLKFILVKDKKKIQKIADAADQTFIATAPYLVVVCSDNTRLLKAYKENGEIYGQQQAGAAIQNFLLALEDKGLASCWIGYFDEHKAKKELKIPSKIKLEAMFPIGYESERSKKKRKMKIDIDRILYFEAYGKMKMKMPKEQET